MLNDQLKEDNKRHIMGAFALAVKAYNPDLDVVSEDRSDLSTYNSKSSVQGRQAAVELIKAEDKETFQAYFDYLFEDDNLEGAWLATTHGVLRLADESVTPEDRHKEAVIVLKSLANFRHVHSRPNMS